MRACIAPQIGPHDDAETLIGSAARWMRKYKAQIGLQQGKAGRVWPLHRGGPGRDPCFVSGWRWRTAQRLFDHLVDRRVRSERGARRRDHAKGNGCVRHIGKTGAEQDEHRGGVEKGVHGSELMRVGWTKSVCEALLQQPGPRSRLSRLTSERGKPIPNRREETTLLKIAVKGSCAGLRGGVTASVGGPCGAAGAQERTLP